MNILFGIIRWCLAGVVCFKAYEGTKWALVGMIGYLFVTGEINTFVNNQAFRATGQAITYVARVARRR